jgi:hypothetical protein
VTSGINMGSNSTLTLTNTISGPGGLVVTAEKGGGTLNFIVSNTYSGGTTISGSTVNVSAAGGLPVGEPVENDSILNVTANNSISQLSGTGSLTVSNSAVLALAGAAVASTQGSVSISSGSTLDITNNRLVIDYGSPSADPAAQIIAAIVSGRNGGSWTGPGLTSSTAALKPSKFAVGYLDGDVASDAAGGTVTANQMIVQYTLAGDAFLQNSVGFDDLVVVAQNFGKTGEDWAQGNFNYDPSGSVGFADLVSVAQNFGATSGVSEGAAGGGITPAWQFQSATIQTTAVNPEPASIALVTVAAGGLLARRRRRIA